MAFCEGQLWGAQKARVVLSEEDMTCNELVRGYLSLEMAVCMTRPEQSNEASQRTP